MPKELEKARVNWHQEISRCPKPKAKFPPLIYGGLPPPPLQTTPRGHLCIPYAKPCQAPPPRPPPRSLATIATSGESESITGCNSSETRPSGKAQPNLVMPTSTPPDICRASRTSYQSSLQHWTEAKRQYEGWLSQLIIAIGPASLIFQEFAHRPVFATVIQQLLRHVGPSTLDLYSRAIQATAIWLKHIGSDWSNFSLQSLVEVLHHAKEASKCDSQSIRLKPAVLLKGLRWLAKTALMEDLLSLLNNTLISSFLKGDGIPRDRKEAVPIPLIVLIRWEETIINPSTPSWLKLLLGGYLLACWASLRFADLQRTDVGSLNLATNSLRGVCRVTKTTRSGQPFAVLLAAFTGESPQTSWIYHWLPTVQEACKRLKFFTPDFIIPVMDNYDTPSFSSPLTYAAAGVWKAIRWAVQTPWSTLTLSSSMAQNITLHSLKVTMLASAAQLRLPHRDRQIQGHHLGGSVQLYSRDDTSDSTNVGPISDYPGCQTGLEANKATTSWSANSNGRTTCHSATSTFAENPGVSVAAITFQFPNRDAGHGDSWSIRWYILFRFIIIIIRMFRIGWRNVGISSKFRRHQTSLCPKWTSRLLPCCYTSSGRDTQKPVVFFSRM